MSHPYLNKHLKCVEGCPLGPNGDAKLYQDSKGIWTIGWGWNIQAHGLPMDICEELLTRAIETARRQLIAAFPVLVSLDEVRQDACVELVYNMGIAVVKTFKNTMLHIEQGEWEAAATGLRQSKWYKDVGMTRAENLINRILTGHEPSQA